MASKAFILSCLASIVAGHGYLTSFGGQAMMDSASTGPAGQVHVGLAAGQNDLCVANGNQAGVFDGGIPKPGQPKRNTYSWKTQTGGVLQNPDLNDLTHAPIIQPIKKHIYFAVNKTVNVTIAIGANHEGGYMIDWVFAESDSNIRAMLANRTDLVCKTDTSKHCMDPVFKTWRLTGWAELVQDPDAQYYKRWTLGDADTEDAANNTLTNVHSPVDMSYANNHFRWNHNKHLGKDAINGAECLYYFHKEVELKFPADMNQDDFGRARFVWGKPTKHADGSYGTDLITMEFYTKCADIRLTTNETLHMVELPQDVDNTLPPAGGGTGGGGHINVFQNKTSLVCPGSLALYSDEERKARIPQDFCESTCEGQDTRNVTCNSFGNYSCPAKAAKYQCYYVDNRTCTGGVIATDLAQGQCCLAKGGEGDQPTCTLNKAECGFGTWKPWCKTSGFLDNCACSPSVSPSAGGSGGCQMKGNPQSKYVSGGCPSGQTCQAPSSSDKWFNCNECLNVKKNQTLSWKCNSRCVENPNFDPTKDTPQCCKCAAGTPSPTPPAPTPPSPAPAPAAGGTCQSQKGFEAWSSFCTPDKCQCAGGAMCIGGGCSDTYCKCPPAPAPPAPAPKSSYKVCPQFLASSHDCAVCDSLDTTAQSHFCNGKYDVPTKKCSDDGALCYKVVPRQLDAPTLIV